MNGHIVREMGFQVNPDQDMVEVDGHAIPYEEKSVAIAFHKPVGVVSTCRISKEKGPAITDFLDLSYRLYPAGRLDRDSSGLVILTNDGDLALRITHPRYGKPKEYLVRLKSPLSRSSLAQLKRGISLEDGVIRPEKVWVLPDGMVGIIITEGRKRIVRRMFEALGNRVMALHRVRIGEVDLGNLGPGTWRYLTEQEVLSFLNRTKP